MSSLKDNNKEKNNSIAKSNKYDPYSKPPDLLMAKHHLKATSVNQADYHDKENYNKLCKCCGRNYHVSKLTIFSSIDRFYHLGTAYPFFFKMLIFFIIIFILGFLSYGIVAISKMPSIIKCSFRKCDHKNFFTEYEDGIIFTHSFAILSLVIFVLSKLLFAMHLEKNELREDKNLISINDFTLYASKLDKKLTNEEIKNIFKENENSENSPNVIKVNKIYNISSFVKSLTKYLLIQKKILNLKKKKEKSTKTYKSLTKKFQSLHKKIEALNTNFNKKEYTGSAFITFNTEKQMQKSQKALKSKYKLKRATQPSDVIWENYGLSKSSKYLRRLFSIITEFLLMTLCFFVLLYLTFLQSNHNKKKNQSLVWLYSFIISTTIIILNFMLRICLYKTTEFEKRPTFSEFQISIVWKVSFALFLNSGLTLLVADQITDGNKKLYNIDGLANNMLVFMAVNSVINSILFFFDPFYFYKLFQRFRVRKRIQKGDTVFQYEVQEVYEQNNFDFDLMNFFSFTSLSICLFFMPIIPFGLVFGILEIFLSYLTYKWILVYRSKIPRELGFKFTKYMMKLFEISLIFMAFGFFTFDLIIIDSVHFLTLFLVLIAVVQFFFLPVDLIFNRRSGSHFHDKTYEECKFIFPNEYDRLNPITQREAIHKWLQSLNIIEKNNDNNTKDDEEPEEHSENFLKSIFDMINNKNKSGQGKNNLFQTKNPFDKKKIKGIFDDMMDSINFYKIEENAYNQNREEKFLKENHDNKNYQPLIDNENNRDINSNYNKGFYSSLKTFYKKINIFEKNKKNDNNIEEINKKELLKNNHELAMFGNHYDSDSDSHH